MGSQFLRTDVDTTVILHYLILSAETPLGASLSSYAALLLLLTPTTSCRLNPLGKLRMLGQDE